MHEKYGDVTFIFVLVSRAGVFRGLESDSDSEEDDSGAGLFAIDFDADFDFGSLATYGERAGEWGEGGSRKLPRHLLRPWR